MEKIKTKTTFLQAELVMNEKGVRLIYIVWRLCDKANSVNTLRLPAKVFDQLLGCCQTEVRSSDVIAGDMLALNTGHFDNLLCFLSTGEQGERDILFNLRRYTSADAANSDMRDIQRCHSLFSCFSFDVVEQILNGGIVADVVTFDSNVIFLIYHGNDAQGDEGRPLVELLELGLRLQLTDVGVFKLVCEVLNKFFDIHILIVCR